MNSFRQTKARTSARARRLSDKSLALILLAVTATALWLPPLLPRASAAGGDVQAASVPSVPDLLWMNGAHAGGVGRAALSPDGQSVASGSGDSTVKLWRVSDGALVRTIQGDGYPVGSVAFAPGGQSLALTTYNGVQLRRASDGALLRSMYVEAGFNNVGRVVFSKDGSVVAVANGSYTPTVWFWRTSDGVLVKSLNRETGWVQPPSLAVSPDGALLGIGRYDSIVELARFPGADASTYRPAYEGTHETADCESLTGWARDSGQPDGVVNVDIYEGSTLLATVPANSYRQDLYDVGRGNGYHAFRYALPASYRDGTPHSFAARVSGTTNDLTGSPRTLTCGSVPLRTPTPTPTPLSTPTPTPTPVTTPTPTTTPTPGSTPTPTPAPVRIEVSGDFVAQHYLDFLSREPDEAGLAFWTGEIESCDADAVCREVKRINVRA